MFDKFKTFLRSTEAWVSANPRTTMIGFIVALLLIAIVF